MFDIGFYFFNVVYFFSLIYFSFFFFFFLMIRRPPRSTLLSLHDALPICGPGRTVRRPRPTPRGPGAASASGPADRKSTRLNSSHMSNSYAVFCLKNKKLYPTSIYAITKRAYEEMALTFGQVYGVPVVALRFFNIYGSRQALSYPFFFLMILRPPRFTLFPYTTLFRSRASAATSSASRTPSSASSSPATCT